MAKADSKHKCPAEGCIRQVPFNQAFCRQHWFALPKAMQNRIWGSWRKCGGTLNEDHVKLLREAADLLKQKEAGGG